MSRSTAQQYKRQDGHSQSMLKILSAFVHRLLHIPMSNGYLTLSTILQRRSGSILSVADVTDVLKHAYKTAVHEDTLSPDHARVCRLDFMKVPIGVQREYILAYVTVDGQPWDEDPAARLGILQCERSVEQEDITPMHHLTAVGIGPKSNDMNTSISESSSDVDDNLKAVDRLIVYDPSDLETLRARKHWCIYKHTFKASDSISDNLLDPTGISALKFNPPKECPLRSREDTSPPRLYDVAAAAIAINRQQPRFDLVCYQCYWFSAMLYYILGGECAADTRVRKRIPMTAAIHVWKTPDGPPVPVPVAEASTFRGLVRVVTDHDVQQLYSESVQRLHDNELQTLYRVLREAVDKALQKDRALLQKDRDLQEKDRIIARLSAALNTSGQPRPSGLSRPH